MLQPKRTKYRRPQKGRCKGNAMRGNQLAFGSFGIKSLETHWITARQDVRMGKGKGDPVGYVFPITPGRIIFEIEGVSYEIAKEALRLASQKLPVTTKFIVRRDYDKNA